MIVPAGAESIREAVRMMSEVFHNLKSILKSKGYGTAVGDEGGFAPNLKSNEEACELIIEAINKTGYKPGEDIYIALDPAASEFYDEKKQKYILRWSTGQEFTSQEMADYWDTWIDKYPIISLEDGMAEDDWEGWKIHTEKAGKRYSLSVMIFSLQILNVLKKELNLMLQIPYLSKLTR